MWSLASDRAKAKTFDKFLQLRFFKKYRPRGYVAKAAPRSQFHQDAGMFDFQLYPYHVLCLSTLIPRCHVAVSYSRRRMSKPARLGNGGHWFVSDKTEMSEQRVSCLILCLITFDSRFAGTAPMTIRKASGRIRQCASTAALSGNI